MISFFVFAEGDLLVESSSLETELRRFWPHVLIARSTGTIFGLEWQLQNGVEGRLNLDNRSVALDGELNDIAEFAAWLRTLVPVSVDVKMTDEGADTLVTLMPGVRGSDIVAAFLEDGS